MSYASGLGTSLVQMLAFVGMRTRWTSEQEVNTSRFIPDHDSPLLGRGGIFGGPESSRNSVTT